MSSAWKSVSAVAGDETGRLYGVGSAGGAQRLIWVAEVSPAALNTPTAQEACVPLSDISFTHIISTQPSINFQVTSAVASANGHHLLLVGASEEDVSVPVLALVDIYGSEPLSQPRVVSSANGSSGSPLAAAAALHPAAKLRLASLQYVHQGLYNERPGMRILQVTWHPASPNHFAALATDNRWRLYHSSQLREAEQTFWLRPAGAHTAAATFGIRRGSSGSSVSPPVFVAFAFGAAASTGWWSLSVAFLSSDGGVYVMCPVAPFGLRMATSVLQQLLDQAEGTAHAWLMAAFLSLLSHEAAVVSARPHMLETAAPALQGPLNRGAESLKVKPTRCAACTMAVTSAVHSSNDSSSSSSEFWSGGTGHEAATGQLGFSVVATGFSNGVVYAHALEIGQVVPVWLDSAPACVFDHRGEVAAVRYEVDAVAVMPALAADVLHDDLSPQPIAAAAAAADIISPLLLLDALKINLHMPPASDGGDEDCLEAEAQVGNVTDSEEESDAGYDPTAASRPMALATAGPSNSGRRFTLFDGEDDDDLEDQKLLQLRQVTLHVAPELPGRFWACHDQGCWGINIRWLQLLASRASSSSKAAAARSASVIGGRDELPAPALQELLVADGLAGGVVSSSVVGNGLLGSGCVALEASGQLWFMRPRPAGVLGAGVVEGAAVGGAGAELAGQEHSAGIEGSQGSGLSELQLTAEELDARARMEDFYGDICRGPRRLPAPAKPANLPQLTAADPAGLAYLNSVTSWLLSTHVQFATGAHADLVERVKQLHAEVAEQSSALTGLQELAAAAAARQAEIASRLSRLTEVAGNLAERGQLLAGLHWSLPRPPSAAEQQLEKQLEVWEQRRDQLKVSWRALRKKIDMYTSAAAGQQQQQAAGSGGTASIKQITPGRLGGGSSSPFLGVPSLAAGRAQGKAPVTASSPGPIAAGKLEKLKQALEMQNHTIAEANVRLAGLFEEVEVFRAEHPEVDLPGKLRSQLIV